MEVKLVNLVCMPKLVGGAGFGTKSEGIYLHYVGFSLD